MNPDTHRNASRYQDDDRSARERGRDGGRRERGDRDRGFFRDDDDRGERGGWRTSQGFDDDDRSERGWRTSQGDDRGRYASEQSRFRGDDEQDRRPSRASNRDLQDFDDEEQHYRGIHTRSIGRSPGGRGVSVSDTYLFIGPFTGRGPKGYQRSDEKIAEEVNERLERHGEVDASEIEVSCAEGVVTLKGKVGDRHSKRLAEDCAESVYSVKDVMNEIRVDKGFFERIFGSGDDEREGSRDRERKKNRG
jgi:hypothetical protein